MKRGESTPRGSWPKLLCQKRAADYLDMSPGFFKQVCDVPPLIIGGQKRWDRHHLDDWIDMLHDERSSSRTESDRIMEVLAGDSGAR